MVSIASYSGIKLSLFYLVKLYQAIGRVIRHKDDYGAIILIDERLSKSFI